MMKESIIAKLTLRDDNYACSLADKIISQSQETGYCQELCANSFAGSG